MNCKAEVIAATRSLAYLELAAWLLEHGDYVASREIVDEGIRQAENTASFSVGGKLRDLKSVIDLKARIGRRDTVDILGRRYFVGTDSEDDPPEALTPLDSIKH